MLAGLLQWVNNMAASGEQFELHKARGKQVSSLLGLACLGSLQS